MDWDQIKGNWLQVKGKVQEKWGALADDALTRLEGCQKQLAGIIQKRYGIAKEEAPRQADERAQQALAVSPMHPFKVAVATIAVVASLLTTISASAETNAETAARLAREAREYAERIHREHMEQAERTRRETQELFDRWAREAQAEHFRLRQRILEECEWRDERWKERMHCPD
jgi:uncharacterized protein YjbJ (UPF0337 family)